MDPWEARQAQVRLGEHGERLAGFAQPGDLASDPSFDPLQCNSTVLGWLLRTGESDSSAITGRAFPHDPLRLSWGSYSIPLRLRNPTLRKLYGGLWVELAVGGSRASRMPRHGTNDIRAPTCGESASASEFRLSARGGSSCLRSGMPNCVAARVAAESGKAPMSSRMSRMALGLSSWSLCCADWLSACLQQALFRSGPPQLVRFALWGAVTGQWGVGKRDWQAVATRGCVHDRGWHWQTE